jgi:hypothetical protein
MKQRVQMAASVIKDTPFSEALEEEESGIICGLTCNSEKLYMQYRLN